MLSVVLLDDKMRFEFDTEQEKLAALISALASKTGKINVQLGTAITISVHNVPAPDLLSLALETSLPDAEHTTTTSTVHTEKKTPLW